MLMIFNGWVTDSQSFALQNTTLRERFRYGPRELAAGIA
jgi:hypothetical protein